MFLSNSTKHAIRALTAIARLSQTGDEPIGLREILAAEDLPEAFLRKILQRLAKSGILRSTKGPHGGFRLGREARQITVLQVIEQVEEISFDQLCLLDNTTCDRRQPCEIHRRWAPVREQVRAFFAGTTVADLMNETVEGQTKHKGGRR